WCARSSRRSWSPSSAATPTTPTRSPTWPSPPGPPGRSPAPSTPPPPPAPPYPAPPAHLPLPPGPYRRLAALLHDLAHTVTQGRWLATGGGGYQWASVVPRAWWSYLAEMVGAELRGRLPEAS